MENNNSDSNIEIWYGDCKEPKLIIKTISDTKEKSEHEAFLTHKTDLDIEEIPKTKAKLVSTSVRKNSACENVHDLPLMSKFQIWKNLLILSFAFLFFLSAFISSQNLQSTLNKEDGVGTISLVVLYFCMLGSSLFLPSVTIHLFGEKRVIIVCMVGYIGYMAANIYPIFPLLILGAIACGLCAGNIWASQTAYVRVLANQHAGNSGANQSDTMALFLGVFYCIFNFCKIIGNVMASVFFSYGGNVTAPTPEEIRQCMDNEGMQSSNISTLERPPEEQVYIICSVWIGLACISIVAACFLTPLGRPKQDHISKRSLIIEKLKVSLVHLHSSKIQWLILPLAIFYGQLGAFLTADFTKSYVGCVLGLPRVGYVLLCHGSCNVAGTIFFGRLKKYLGFPTLFSFGFACYGAIFLTLLLWRQSLEHAWSFYIIAAVWGMAESIQKVQTLALYSYMFPTNPTAVFGVYFMGESAGMISGLAYSTTLATQTKLIILITSLVITAVGYYVAEVLHRRKR